ncbi:MAG TPA: arginine deiminase family protein, partial [Sphingomonadales bacterium]|nr:arginine deiminase family protein [Sphingomonadales bacterium]
HAFVSKQKIDREWQKLRFHGAPDLDSALVQHRIFAAKLQAAGAKVIFLGGGEGLTLDSIYAHDALVLTPRGLILCRMGRATRRSEPALNARELERKGFAVTGEIEAPGTLEGGDFLWFDEATAAVGLGPRTNQAGIEQLGALLGNGVELHVVPLPPPSHPEDVMHLMSVISPVDADLAVVYRPLLPDSFADWLEKRGVRLIEVLADEYPKMACNVLALQPRHVVMIEGCPKTQALLESAGCRVETYNGSEISLKGDGGPTCLVRPLVRT